MLKLSALITILLTVLTFNSYSQTRDEQKTINEIISAYKSHGIEGLKDYLSRYPEKINSELITEKFAKKGQSSGDSLLLQTAEALSLLTNDTLALANVYYFRAQYEFTSGNNEQASEFYNMALPLFIKFGDKRGKGNVFMGQGELCFYTGQPEEAINKYSGALTEFLQAGDSLGEANVYLKQGILNFYSGNDENAIQLYSKALSIFQKLNNSLGQGNVYLRQGELYYYAGENDKSLDLYSKAISCFRDAGYLLGLGNVYLSLGTFYAERENQKALEMFNEALNYFKQANYLQGQGNTSRSIGELYSYLGDIDRAKEYYLKALEIFKQTGNPTGQANVCQNLGVLYKLSGDYYKAEKLYLNAFHLFEQMQDPLGKGAAYLNLGDIYKNSGKYENALEQYSKALPLFELANSPIGIGNTYKSYGDIFLKTGENYKALEMYNKAIKILNETGTVITQGNIYASLSLMYLNMQDYLRSQEMSDSALSIFQQIEHLLGIANVYSNEGDAFLQEGKYTEAFKRYNEALPAFKQINDILGIGNTYLGLGICYYKWGDKLNASAMYNNALNIFENSENLEGKVSTFMALAQLYRSESDYDNAFKSYSDAVDMLEKLRKQTGFTDLKLSFQENVLSYYNEAVSFMLESGHTAAAFKYAEALKGRAFLDQLTEKNIGQVNKGLDPELKVQITNAKCKVSALKAGIQNAQSDSLNKIFQKEIAVWESRLDSLIQKVRFENPLYASVNYYAPAEPDSIQKYILKPSEVLVEYFVGPQDVYAFIITKESFNIEKLPVAGEELIKYSGGYVTKFLIKPSRGTELLQDYSEISDLLVKPLLKYLQNKKDLIIVPDAQLSLLPFEAIPVSYDEKMNPHYLIEDYNIKYIQSAALLAFQRTYYKGQNIRNSFIGFGDPVYDLADYLSGKKEEAAAINDSTLAVTTEVKRDNYQRFGSGLTRLEGTGAEVKSIAEIFRDNKLDSKINLREDATEEKVKSNEMKEFGYINFACHGLLSGDFQCIVLSQIPGLTEDGYLSIDEIMDLDWNARLVVLSACQTGKGEFRKGEGIVGLTRAVLYAGSRGALVSLWSVSDEGTKELMIKFFRNLVEKDMIPAEALRQAKIEMLQTDFSDPFYWAAFVLYGE